MEERFAVDLCKKKIIQLGFTTTLISKGNIPWFGLNSGSTPTT